MKTTPMVALYKFSTICGLFLASSMATHLYGDVVTIPDSALVSSTSLYTDTIGGGLGDSNIMARNDDGSSAIQNLGFSLTFFGNTYTQFYVNNNGNISFGGPIGQYTPSGPQGASQPIISPFFADVDTRNPTSGLVYLRTDIPNEIIVTWSQVGYYSEHVDKLDNFQLVLRSSDYNIPNGEGQIGFFYTNMQWETGDASSGSGGFGGNPAAVGFGDGLSNGEILQGSTQNGISGIVNDTHIWFDVNASGVPIVPVTPTDTPEPGSILFAATGIGALVLARLRSRRSNLDKAQN